MQGQNQIGDQLLVVFDKSIIDITRFYISTFYSKSVHQGNNNIVNLCVLYGYYLLTQVLCVPLPHTTTLMGISILYLLD